MIKELLSILRDYIIALRIRFSSENSRITKSKEISLDASRRLLSLVSITLCWFTGGVSALIGVVPPYGVTSIYLILASIVCFTAAFLFPFNRGDAWRRVLIRFAASYVLIIGSGELFDYHKNEIDSGFTPQERAVWGRNKEQTKVQDSKQERDNRERRQEAEIKREIEIDARAENRKQRDFYDELGAPKILYKCKDSPFESAIGAKFGSINRLIETAQSRCADAGYKIIKREG